MYQFFRTFLDVARVRKHTAMRELHEFRFACNSRMFLTLLALAGGLLLVLLYTSIVV